MGHRFSFRAKLFLGLAGLAVLSLVSVYFSLTSFLVAEVEAYLVAESRGMASGLVSSLALHYERSASWENVASVFAEHEEAMCAGGRGMGADCPMSRFQWGDAALLADGQGRVVFASSADLPHAELSAQLLSRALPVLVRGERVGSLLTGAMLGRWSRLEQSLLSAVRRSVAFATAASAVLVLLIGTLLLRSITGPFQRLVGATRRIAGGELSEPVPSEGRDETGELARTLENLRCALSRSEEGRRRLLADIAHELRNPLAVLRAKVEAMMDGLREPTPELLASLDDRLVHLSRLVDELQDVALAEAGELRLDREEVDLAALLREVAADAQSLALRDGKMFRLDLPVERLPVVQADRRRLLQILWNLLTNATRHTRAGQEISLSAGRRGEAVEIRVADTGEGMDEETRRRLFDRFHTSTRKGGGLGLGLAISRELVRAHGGEISVTSAPGKGTEVSFTLPCGGDSVASPRGAS